MLKYVISKSSVLLKIFCSLLLAHPLQFLHCSANKQVCFKIKHTNLASKSEIYFFLNENQVTYLLIHILSFIYFNSKFQNLIYNILKVQFCCVVTKSFNLDGICYVSTLIWQHYCFPVEFCCHCCINGDQKQFCALTI